MKILCLLVTCLNPTNRLCNNGDERMQQFINGLEKFYHYASDFPDNVDICITDNTTTQLPESINSIIPSNTQTILCTENGGKKNKGVGLIKQWRYCKDVIAQYDYIIHFEPRQLLTSNLFFTTFFNDLTDLFTYNINVRVFNTGLIAMKTSTLINYIDTIDTNKMENENISIEYNLYDFYIDNHLTFNTIEKMGLIWYDGHREHHW